MTGATLEQGHTSVPLLPLELLERIEAAGNRFVLVCYEKGKERGRAPLWLPYWPSSVGQRVVATAPSVFPVSAEWKIDGVAIESCGQELMRDKAAWPPGWAGDTYSVEVTVIGEL